MEVDGVTTMLADGAVMAVDGAAVMVADGVAVMVVDLRMAVAVMAVADTLPMPTQDRWRTPSRLIQTGIEFHLHNRVV